MLLKYINIKNILSLCLLVLVALVGACDKEDDTSNQVVLNSFGPSVLRSGELKFIGRNLNKVSSIVLPDNIEISSASFTSQSGELITLVVPDQAVEGFVTLKTSSGNIVTKSKLSILEPITIKSFPTTAVRPREVITIEGTYLNLIKRVVFADAKAVTEFESQSRTTLKVRVPADAQTGKLSLFDSEEIPNEIKTQTPLLVKLPSISGIAPTTVKAGNKITLSGTDLDLVVGIELAGNQSVDSANFVSQSASQIILTVPADTDDGSINLIAPSKIKITSTSSLTLSLPTITSITPAPAKTGGEITVSGTDLDLVSEVVFAGDKKGTIKIGGTATSIVVSVPVDAKDGAITFNTKANKNVKSTAIDLVKPAFTTLATNVKLNEDFIITGTNLDIVKTVKLSGGTEGVIKTKAETQLVVTVPLGTITGKVTLIATNGDEIASTGSLTILADVPVFTTFPVMAKPGTKLTLTGTKLNLTNEVIFPGNKKATRFGDRTATTLEVYIPEEVQTGLGKITFSTYGTDVTESTNINFTWADPVVNTSLVFFDFDSKGSWWGGAVVENVTANSLDGTKYAKIAGTFSGWTDGFWRNSKDNFPVATIGTNVSDYNFKFDIYVRSAITAGNLKFRLGDYYYCYGPAAPGTQGQKNIDITPGWVTVSISLSDFRDNYGWGNQLTDLNAVGNGQFGLAWDNGNATVDVLIDNVRFEHK